MRASLTKKLPIDQHACSSSIYFNLPFIQGLFKCSVNRESLFSLDLDVETPAGNM